MTKANPTPPPGEPTASVDWRTDPYAQAMMSILVAAGVDMYRKREKQPRANRPARAQAPEALQPAIPDPTPPTTRRKTKTKLTTMGVSTS